MMCDIVETALQVNNTFAPEETIHLPFAYLTRKESEPLHDLDFLNRLKIQVSNYTLPYKMVKPEEKMLLDYQKPCQKHLKKIFRNLNTMTVYVSMAYISDYLKSDYPELFYSQYYKHFHLVFDIVSFNDETIEVKSHIVDNRNTFINLQEEARKFEKHFNLKYNLRTYYDCHHCLPTLCALAIYHKPCRMYQVPETYSEAINLVKNDRIDIKVLCDKAQQKWNVEDEDAYKYKMYQICQQRDWQYEKVITLIHKTHYALFKACESLRDKNVNYNQWIRNKRDMNSPTWRNNRVSAQC